MGAADFVDKFPGIREVRCSEALLLLLRTLLLLLLWTSLLLMRPCAERPARSSLSLDRSNARHRRARR